MIKTFLFGCIIIILSPIFAKAQSKDIWNIDESLKITCQIVQNIEDSGYIVKAINFKNIRYTDKFDESKINSTLSYSSSSLNDTLYIVSIVIVNNDRVNNDFKLNGYSLSLFREALYTKKTMNDSLIKQEISFTKNFDKKNQYSIYTWKTFINPYNVFTNNTGFSVFKIKFTNNDILKIGLINQEGIKEGDTKLTHEEIAKKSGGYVQNIIIAYSKS